ncbi:MAG: hypothetical protein MJA29_13845 [Candidatus Omnitrophica bacterium]|nr:hypothetical protein [Candidatus Omnitrophota bacterium]
MSKIISALNKAKKQKDAPEDAKNLSEEVQGMQLNSDSVRYINRSKASWFTRLLMVLFFAVIIAANVYMFYLVQQSSGRMGSVVRKVEKVEVSVSQGIKQMRQATKSLKDAEAQIKEVREDISSVGEKVASVEKSAGEQTARLTALEEKISNSSIGETVEELRGEITEVRDKITYLMMNQLKTREATIR